MQEPTAKYLERRAFIQGYLTAASRFTTKTDTTVAEIEWQKYQSLPIQLELDL